MSQLFTLEGTVTAIETPSKDGAALDDDDHRAATLSVNECFLGGQGSKATVTMYAPQDLNPPLTIVPEMRNVAGESVTSTSHLRMASTRRCEPTSPA